MLAIYKKELKSYLTSMQGYVFMAFIMLVLGIYFTAYNLNYASPDFGTTLNSVTFVFLIITPILTMRILAEEKRNKTDQLLFTSPVPIWKIEFGKYLGHAMANLAAVADPSAIVIGGGVSKAGEVLLQYVEKNFKEKAFFANKDTEFVLATLGNDAGICGAAKLIL